MNIAPRSYTALQAVIAHGAQFLSSQCFKRGVKTPATSLVSKAVSAGALVMTAATVAAFSTSALAEESVNTTGLAVTDTDVTVGILHSLTGTMAISETGAQEAEKLAIKQINDMGGILGRQIKVIQEDGASDWPTFAEKSRKLLVKDKVAAVFGCWTSASRKAALPVFEKENGLL